MIKKLLRPKVFLALLVLLISVSAFSALAASNSVPGTHSGDSSQSITAADLAPPECASIASSLTSISITPFFFPDNNALILGTGANDWLLGDWFGGGSTGNHCIVLGSGNDTIFWGSNHNEIILGGPGNDNIDGGGGYDICYGNGGTDSFTNCEEWYQ